MGSTILLIVVIALLAVMIYIRFAPSDPARWHIRAPDHGTESRAFKRGYVWRKGVEGDGKAELAALDAAAMGSDRTERLTGSVDEGMITYVSRTKWMKFPDYTTIGLYDVDGKRVLEAYGRLRFGRSDLGVNGKRIRGWVADAKL